MHHHRFDTLTRALSGVPSRRRVLRGLGATGIGLAWGHLSDPAAAKKKRKRKKGKAKKAKPNQYGCFEVGDPCQIPDQCCSGICEGKKGKRKCRAHDTGTCDQDRPGYCTEENPYLAACDNGKGVCFRTTAGSNICANEFVCGDCQWDADCVALGAPAGAACAPVSEGICGGVCESVMACVFPNNETPEE